MDEKLSKYLEGIDHSRREAIKKLVMGTAFAAPVVASFSLGAKAAECPTLPILKNDHLPPLAKTIGTKLATKEVEIHCHASNVTTGPHFPD